MNQEEQKKVTELMADYRRINQLNNNIISLYKEQLNILERTIETNREIIEDQKKLIVINEKIYDQKIAIVKKASLIGFLIIVLINIIGTIL